MLGERLRTKVEAETMAMGEKVVYTDSTGRQHTIQEYGRNTVATGIGGSWVAFDIEGVLIDNKKWVEYENTGIGNPVEQAKEWIEEQIEARKS